MEEKNNYSFNFIFYLYVRVYRESLCIKYKLLK